MADKQIPFAIFDPHTKGSGTMANNHLVRAEIVLPPLIPWLRGNLGIEVDRPEAVDVLFYDRFGSELSAIVLLPESVAPQLPLPNRAITRGHSAKIQREADSPYQPPARTPRPDIQRGERTFGIEKVDCREVSLRMSTTRVSSWGINLDLLKRDPDLDTTIRSFLRWIELNGFLTSELTPETIALLHATFAVALTEKLDPARTFKAPRMPVIHNQRCGMRYRLHFDRAKMGSPCDVHVLLYPEGRKPVLYGVPAVDRPTAGEHKAGLALLQTWDKRIRFYQLTDRQWAEWTALKPQVWALPTSLRQLVEQGLVAAEKLRV